MEAEDDMIVLVVADEDDRAMILETSNSSNEVYLDDAIKTFEPVDNDEYQCDYLEDERISESNIKEEPNMGDDDYVPDDEYIPDEEEYLQLDDEDSSKGTKIRRFTMLKPAQQRSFVEELRQQFDELRDDQELLMYTLKKIMKQVKPPPPPQDYYIMNGILFECVFCEFLSETIPAASRHYQERHGQRYLVCYACGVDFRSTTNLYKHEKRCIAPDADLVLKARAAFLGRKGRSRPYLKQTSKKRIKFPCSLCSAVFITKNNLKSHENLHRGERPYRCQACPCAYTSYSALSRHRKKHTDVQFICDHCSRSFKIKAALVAHMDTHKPIRKHGCSECNRRFAQKSALMLHVNKIHRNLPPPCACQICPKRYPRMYLLKAHMKRAHGLSIITRKMFFKTLPTMTDLEIKQSKIVLKNAEVDLLDFTRMVKTEPVTEKSFHIKLEPEQSDQDFEEEYADSNRQDTSQDMSMDEFMQYVAQGDQETNSKVYIQNGEVVMMNNVETVQNNLVLMVEPMNDGETVVKSVSEIPKGAQVQLTV